MIVVVFIFASNQTQREKMWQENQTQRDLMWQETIKNLYSSMVPAEVQDGTQQR